MAQVVFINFTDDDKQTNLYTTFDNINGNTSIDRNEITVDVLKSLATLGDTLVLIKPNQVVSATSTQIDSLITYLSNPAVRSQIDVFYLTTAMDNCMNRVELSQQPTDTISGYTIERSVSPTGFNAIIIPKEKIENLITKLESRHERHIGAKLSALVRNGTISTGISQPMFVYPDLNSLFTPMDMFKTQYCRIENDDITTNRGDLSLIWFSVGLSLVVILVWITSFYKPYNNIKYTR